MKPVKHDLSLYKGQTYNQNLRFKAGGEPILLNGITAKSQIRPSENSPKLIAELECTVFPQEGLVTLALSAEKTALINSGSYDWDLKMTNQYGEVDYYVYGKFIVTGRVTV